MKYKRRGVFLAVLVLASLYPSAAHAARKLFAGTDRGLYRSDDSGQTWSHVSFGSVDGTAGLPGVGAVIIDPSNPQIIYAEAANGLNEAIYRSSDGGSNWSRADLGVSVVSPRKRLAIDFTRTNTVYFGGNGLFKSTDSGRTWSRPAITSTIEALDTDPNESGTVYISVGGQGVFKSTDFGETFTAPALRGFALGNLGVVEVTDVVPSLAGGGILYATGAGTCFDPAAPGLTGYDCGVFISLNGGQTWGSLGQTGWFRNLSVDACTGSLYAGGRTTPFSGNVIRSDDGGITWTGLNRGFMDSGLQVLVDPDDSAKLYAFRAFEIGGEATGIYLSVNGGLDWTARDILSTDPDTRVVTKVGVNAIAIIPDGSLSGVLHNVSVGGYRNCPVAPDSIVAAFGTHLATGQAAATAELSPTLGGSAVRVTDSAGVTRPALLFFVSPGQINYLLPAQTAPGIATVTITAGDGATSSGQVRVAQNQPGLITLNSANLAAANVLRLSNGVQTAENVYQVDLSGAVVAKPIDLGPPTDQVYLVLYGTGLRSVGTTGTGVVIGGILTPVAFAGAQGAFTGLDQVNVLLPRALAGRGIVQLIVVTAGRISNTATVSIK